MFSWCGFEATAATAALRGFGLDPASLEFAGVFGLIYPHHISTPCRKNAEICQNYLLTRFYWLGGGWLWALLWP